jgi:hypothetical protein
MSSCSLATTKLLTMWAKEQAARAGATFFFGRGYAGRGKMEMRPMSSPDAAFFSFLLFLLDM